MGLMNCGKDVEIFKRIKFMIIAICLSFRSEHQNINRNTKDDHKFSNSKSGGCLNSTILCTFVCLYCPF